MKLQSNINHINKTSKFGSLTNNQITHGRPNSLNFKGNAFVLADEFINNKGLNTILQEINDAFGKTTVNADGKTVDYFTNLLDTAKISNLKIKNYTLAEGFFEAIKAPIDIVNFLSKKLFNFELFKGRAAQKIEQKAMEQAREILEVYKKCQNKQEFQEKVATEISNLAKNYSSRDERTINRIVTATVSAVFASNDFYNISIYQKDDQKEAKKAAKGKFKLEITRMGLSALITFLTLGVLDKYTRKNVYLNAAAIAAGTLLSETISRILHKTPLHPLTPKEAEKMAQKNGNKQPQQVKSENGENKTKYTPQFAKSATFSYFNNQNINAHNVMTKNITCEHKKSKILKIIIGLIAASNIIYAAGHLKSGKSEKCLADIVKNAADKIKKYDAQIDLTKLKETLNVLSANEKSKEVEGLINTYKEFVDAFDGNEIVVQKSRPLVAGIIDGVLKIPKTLYSLLSAPARQISSMISKTPQSTIHKSNTQARKMALATLEEIIEKNTNGQSFTKDSSEIINAIVEDIKLNTRNISAGQQETGELAHISRNLVTLIGSYFFVNDYRNRVLIDSAGKDIEGANEETKERIAHKCANFIINGTLMNLSNSIFKLPLNASLLAAAIIPTITEMINETFVRLSICQPITRKKSRAEIEEFDKKLSERKGLAGLYTKAFTKLTGKKTFTQSQKSKMKK